MAIVYVTGKGSWFQKVFQYDEYRGTKFYALKFYPEEDSIQKLKDAGKQIKEDAEGKYVTLRRNVAKRWKLRPGEDPEFGPPEVVDADSKPWPSDKLIGNTSKVTCKLDVYNSVNGPGSRLEAVRIDELVEYQKSVDTSVQAPVEQQKPIEQKKVFPF